ncbi:MAG: pilus assembly protein PilP [Candidatus Thiodiazotropha sp.]|nr:pilus assembly protein PilP [Candidatus Thiodiazotropha taylori]MBT3058305.1 pilus assembly protein PilP [Candidatus Thiodiazotropha sp. (ex Lucina pensylvanica)]MBV2093939.1 pilus assembly protein PilP [Candidatus Thiodiazotropha sp. (ex Codakia orbicularis)]PUB74457.1 MAG: pilus assembly protein PilP [gamma proteobacterium symbiont of Ctena orbiculata]MBT3062862.1 pilus assembly protein PilP [Candidatus Thiodiazotropha sp. (ex Lucina pensylvanica)]
MSMRILNDRILWLPLLFSVAVVSGCANPNLDELRGFVAQQKAQPPERIEPLPEIRQIETFIYSDTGRRNPFLDMFGDQAETASVAGSGIRPDFNRRKEELETYPLDSIRMVGTLEQIGATWGLVKTKEGTVHKVKSGNYMGQNHGRIVLISEDRIELTEIVQDGSGGYIERQASLALAE